MISTTRIITVPTSYINVIFIVIFEVNNLFFKLFSKILW